MKRGNLDTKAYIEGRGCENCGNTQGEDSGQPATGIDLQQIFSSKDLKQIFALKRNPLC